MGEKCLQRLAALHEAELLSLRHTFRVSRITELNDQETAQEQD